MTVHLFWCSCSSFLEGFQIIFCIVGVRALSEWVCMSKLVIVNQSKSKRVNVWVWDWILIHHHPTAASWRTARLRLIAASQHLLHWQLNTYPLRDCVSPLLSLRKGENWGISGLATSQRWEKQLPQKGFPKSTLVSRFAWAKQHRPSAALIHNESRYQFLNLRIPVNASAAVATGSAATMMPKRRLG